MLDDLGDLAGLRFVVYDIHALAADQPNTQHYLRHGHSD